MFYPSLQGTHCTFLTERIKCIESFLLVPGKMCVCVDEMTESRFVCFHTKWISFIDVTEIIVFIIQIRTVIFLFTDSQNMEETMKSPMHWFAERTSMHGIPSLI